MEPGYKSDAQIVKEGGWRSMHHFMRSYKLVHHPNGGAYAKLIINGFRKLDQELDEEDTWYEGYSSKKKGRKGKISKGGRSGRRRFSSLRPPVPMNPSRTAFSTERLTRSNEDPDRYGPPNRKRSRDDDETSSSDEGSEDYVDSDLEHEDPIDKRLMESLVLRRQKRSNSNTTAYKSLANKKPKGACMSRLPIKLLR